MKTNIFRTITIATILVVALFSCVQSIEPETSPSEVATRALQDKNSDVDFYYFGSDKIYFDVRRDRVIVKTASVAEAENFSKQDVVLSVGETWNAGKWGFVSADVKGADLKSVLRSKATFDMAYGLEADGMMHYPTNQVFVQCVDRGSPENVLAKVGLSDNVTDIELFNPYSKIYLITLNVALGDVLKISRDMYETGLCEYTEPNLFQEMKLANTNYPLQWGLNNTGQSGGTVGLDINAEQAWTITRGNPNIKVAVFDTGVDLTHPDLQANILPGYDGAIGAPSGVNGGPVMDNYNAHGTACAGIIGAIDNSIGVVGVASACKIIPIRIGRMISTSRYFQGLTFDGIARSVRYAWETAGADVLSNSWSGRSYTLDKGFQDAMIYGRGGKGCVVVFSSGNDDSNSASWAGSDPRTIIVGAMSPIGERIRKPKYSWGSNYGEALDIMAPGTNIPTTDLQGNVGYSQTADVDYYNYFNGTSAACPHVAGVAALILSVNPNITVEGVTNIIESTAQKVGGYSYATTSGRSNGTWHQEMGHGLVDAYAAVSKAALIPNISITGRDAPALNVNDTYSVPTSLPTGVTFTGWTITPSTYVAANGLSNRTLTVKFTAAGAHTITANFTMSNGTAFTATKNVVSTVYPPPPPPEFWVSSSRLLSHEEASLLGRDEVYWVPPIGSGSAINIHVTYQSYVFYATYEWRNGYTPPYSATGQDLYMPYPSTFMLFPVGCRASMPGYTTPWKTVWIYASDTPPSADPDQYLRAIEEAKKRGRLSDI